MNKKLIISLSIIGVVAAVAIGGTIAYFNDTETSAGNIFTAGTIDLKVDHLAQTYNGVDCKTCSVEIKSDTTNLVVSTMGGDDPVSFSHAAKQVSNPHQAWTVTGDIPGAIWIWATDPTTEHDSGNNDVYYTFEKTFEWWGPISGATLSLGVGTDNGYEIRLNGDLVGQDMGEYNYRTPADTYSSFASLIDQGTNVLSIKVKNKALQGGTPSTNPGGLLYKLTINGNCGDDYFKANCRLWGQKDLVTGDTFFKFNDIKPGDQGTNLISLHVDSNDAWSCLFVDKTGVDGEQISETLNVVVWNDLNQNGVHDASEPVLYQGPLAGVSKTKIVVGDSTPKGTKIIGGTTRYVGLAWCFGEQTTVSDSSSDAILCNGEFVGNDAQGDTLSATLTAYAEQWRNNSTFVCSQVQ